MRHFMIYAVSAVIVAISLVFHFQDHIFLTKSTRHDRAAPLLRALDGWGHEKTIYTGFHLCKYNPRVCLMIINGL